MCEKKIRRDSVPPVPDSSKAPSSTDFRSLKVIVEQLERYREFIDFLPEIIFEADASGRLTYVNKAAFAAIGTTPDELDRGIHIFDVIHPSDLDSAKYNLGLVARGEKSHGNEYTLVRRDGSSFDGLVYSTPIIEEGHVQGLRGIVVDISDRKEHMARQKLLRGFSGELAVCATLEEIADAIRRTAITLKGVDCGGLYATDARSGDLILVNAWGLSDEFKERVRRISKESEQFKRLSLGELIITRHRDAYREDDPIRKKEGLRALSSTPIFHDGKMVAALNIASHSKDVMPLATSEMIEDITNHLGGAIARILTESEMREQDRKYRAVVENSREVVFLLNESLQFMSDRIFDLTGYTQEELRAINPISLLHPDDIERFMPMWLEKGKKIELPASYEFRIIDKGGRTHYCSASLTGIEFHGEKSILGTVRDITEERKAQEELEKVGRMQALGLLARGIAHDFNNYLGAIVGNISYAQKSLESGRLGDIADPLKDAEHACDQAANLNQRLLTFAKGGAPIKMTRSLTEVAQDTVKFTLSGSDVSVDYMFERELPPVEIDSGQISQVVQNIIVNAIQAMGDRKDKRIEVKAFEYQDMPRMAGLIPGRHVALSISDNGCGIPASDLHRIFDPFFTTKKTGSGLGLATSFSIIQKHNGVMLVDSTVGKGSVFTIILPASDKQPVVKADSVKPVEGNGRILVMDDEVMIRNLSERILSKHGYAVDQAENGSVAIALFQEAIEAGNPFDVVILDLTVQSGMGGLEALKILKKIDPTCKFIVSSGYNDSNAMADYLDFGFDAVLPKPYKHTELMMMIDQVRKIE